VVPIEYGRGLVIEDLLLSGRRKSFELIRRKRWYTAGGRGRGRRFETEGNR
jgi:hypothetical protein